MTCEWDVNRLNVSNRIERERKRERERKEGRRTKPTFITNRMKINNPSFNIRSHSLMRRYRGFEIVQMEFLNTPVPCVATLRFGIGFGFGGERSLGCGTEDGGGWRKVERVVE